MSFCANLECRGGVGQKSKPDTMALHAGDPIKAGTKSGLQLQSLWRIPTEAVS